MSLSLHEITKRFGDVVALDNLSLDVRRGEFFTLLGPSGCGKSTTLKIIAGFYKPDRGKIYIDEELVNNVPPYERNLGYVFQNYALFPHMSVFENVAYGLKAKKLPRDEIRRRVKEALELVGLEGFEDRRPDQLSGGQQQRVALARAIVINPKILLLDEPLSNLDAKLRLYMRTELKKIQRELKITAIYVTHDQDEARTLSDRIAVMKSGKIEQVGSPHEIFYNPRTRYVADFVGFSNFIESIVKDIKRDRVVIDLLGRPTEIMSDNEEFKLGEKVIVTIRPEFVKILTGGEAATDSLYVFEGIVEGKNYIGSVVRYQIRIGDTVIMADHIETPRTAIEIGRRVKIGFEKEMLRILKG